jgi:tRNA A37 threonylcarbamoyladenosine dehydratase
VSRPRRGHESRGISEGTAGSVSVCGTAYRIDSADTSDLATPERTPSARPEATIVIVGCGGTGSHLAEATCRLLIGVSAELYLVDMDRVEAHNVGRQAFLCGIC